MYDNLKTILIDVFVTQLEYIFAKLNKIDTQNSKKVIGFIPEAFRNDFKYLFPYWKEKRQNNVSRYLILHFIEFVKI